MQRFLPFLADGAADGLGGEALAVTLDDVDWLLATPVEEFWAVAKTDPSLGLLLATFLQHAKCALVWPIMLHRPRRLHLLRGISRCHTREWRCCRRSLSHRTACRCTGACAGFRCSTDGYIVNCRRPYDDSFQEQSATEAAVWQRVLPLLHRL
jgi:hypothetical protein